MARLMVVAVPVAAEVATLQPLLPTAEPGVPITGPLAVSSASAASARALEEQRGA